MKQTNTGRAHLTGATTTQNGANAAKISKGMTRPERWGEYARAYFENLRGNEIMIPVEWLEEVERKPMHEVIVNRLISERGWGATNPTRDQEYRLEYDAAYEAAGTRTRNAHERTIVRQECFAMTLPHANTIDRADLHEFIRRFYHAGDRGLDNAIRRAVKCALAWEREAEEMTKPIPKNILDAVQKIAAKQ